MLPIILASKNSWCERSMKFFLKSCFKKRPTLKYSYLLKTKFHKSSKLCFCGHERIGRRGAIENRRRRKIRKTNKDYKNEWEGKERDREVEEKIKI